MLYGAKEGRGSKESNSKTTATTTTTTTTTGQSNWDCICEGGNDENQIQHEHDHGRPTTSEWQSCLTTDGRQTGKRPKQQSSLHCDDAMPKQSRGFWVCNYCQTQFDGEQEATFHEIDCRQQRSVAPPGQQDPGAAAAAAAGQPQHPPPPVGSVAFASAHPSSLHPGAMPPYDTRDKQLQQQQEGSPPPVAHGYDYMRKLRRAPFVVSHQPNNLKGADAITCQSIELFETYDDSMPAAGSGAAAATTTATTTTGRLGLRCTHCVDTSAQTAESFSFPRNIAGMGNSVRLIAETHLIKCAATPDRLRQLLENAIRIREQSNISASESGSASQEDEASRRALAEYCETRCQQLAIVDKYPENSGIAFRDSHPVVDMGAPSSSLPPPIALPQHARPLGSTAGSDPLALTPLLSRRRESDIHSATSQPRTTPMSAGGERQQYDAPPYTPGSMAFGQQHDPANLSYTAYGPRPGEGAEAASMGAATASFPDDNVSAPAPGYQHLPSFDLPSNFPFLQEHNGDWVCRFCSHVHPQYRDPDSIWSVSTRTPPPGSFIDHHLNLCRYYHQTLNQSPGTYEFPGPASFGFMPAPGAAYSGGHPQSQAWDPNDPRGAAVGPPSAPLEYAQAGREMQPSPYEPLAGRAAASPKFPDRLPRSQAAKLAAPGSPDSASRQAIDYLASNDQSQFTEDGEPIADDLRLVWDEDKLLLTDYFFYLMKQLRMVRFSEADRKTRGGKREKIQVGYGGLQCVHCADAPNARKFFWSNVDRLANSFAEIPGHVLKCRRCSQQVKDALLQLKQRHPEQMARLPRGSQKVFFRRMWRRVHGEDPLPAGAAVLGAQVPPPPLPTMLKSPPPTIAALPPLGSPPEEVQYQNPNPAAESKQQSSPDAGTSGSSEESMFMLDRPSQEAAQALAVSAMQEGPPSPSSRVLLAIPEDREWLSDFDCFIRRQLEVFCASRDDVQIAQADRKYPVQEGQVGIRCIHCALAKHGMGATGAAVAYPFSINGVYESVREFQRLHLESCPNLSPSARSKLTSLKGSSSLSSVLRKYYVLAAKALGLQDTRAGVRAGAESVPLGSQAAFAFSEGPGETAIEQEIAQQMEREAAFAAAQQPAATAATAVAAAYPAAHQGSPISPSRKRPQEDGPEGSTDSKRSARSPPGEPGST